MKVLATVLTIVFVGIIPSTHPSKSVTRSYETYRDSFSSSSSSSSGSGYKVSFTSLSVNGKCISTLNIVGHGIRKLIDYPCKGVPFPIVNFNQTLVVGNEYYTESPGILVHVGDSCTAEYFHPYKPSPRNTLVTLSKEDCDKIKHRMAALHQYFERWQEYYQNKNKEAQQHLQALQSNLQAALGGIFGGFGK